MKIEKKLIKESLGYTQEGKKTFSKKKLNVFVKLFNNQKIKTQLFTLLISIKKIFCEKF